MNYLSKDMNSPAVSDLIPIDDFRGMIKQKAFAKNWQAYNHDDLKRRIRRSLRDVDTDAVTNMMTRVRCYPRRGSHQRSSSLQPYTIDLLILFMHSWLFYYYTLLTIKVVLLFQLLSEHPLS